ncbi:MAG: PilZ domain-containing protein [bacterium]
MKGEEKRRQIRVFTSVPITFHSERSEGEMNGQMIDVSLSGMRFASSEQVELNANLKMKFVLPNNLGCIFIGKVVTKAGGDNQQIYGVNFIKQDPVERMNLSEYIMDARMEQEKWIRGKSSEKPGAKK